jgi:MFS transporter, DHA3 family, macrolide efflux protein
MIQALRHPQIKKLWFAQALSSIGDEIYRVGLIWLAIKMMGNDTGYLAAGQTASLLCLSFLGGRWADQWDPRKTMISVDILRAILVLIPVAISFFMTPPLTVLWFMAFSVSGLSAFFDPATQGLIPQLAKTPTLVKSTNGLMSTTIRMARMIGPAIVGLLSVFIPMIHFFSIDALTFIISALCVYSLGNFMPVKPQSQVTKSVKTDFKTAVMSGFRLTKTVPGMGYVFFAKGLITGGWNLVIIVGFPLLVHNLTGGDVRSFGYVMASYGIGNFIGALYFGNRERKNSWFYYFFGHCLHGLGYLAIGFAPNLSFIIAAAIYCGFTGPINDLGFVDMIQDKFKGNDVIKMFRLRLTVESATTLVFTVLSPWLIKLTSVETMIILSGVLWLICGMTGLIFRKHFLKEAV